MISKACGYILQTTQDGHKTVLDRQTLQFSVYKLYSIATAHQIVFQPVVGMTESVANILLCNVRHVNY